MFDIIVYLFESYFDTGSYPGPDKLAVKLSAAGFEQDEITQAVKWLSGLQEMSHSDYPAIINKTGSRCFADLERQRICADGLLFISFWEQNNVISPVVREMILDRAVAFGLDGLGLDKIKLIARMVLWNQNEELDPLVIEDLLTPSNSSLLH